MTTLDQFGNFRASMYAAGFGIEDRLYRPRRHPGNRRVPSRQEATSDADLISQL
jgi:hypothetical protein